MARQAANNVPSGQTVEPAISTPRRMQVHRQSRPGQRVGAHLAADTGYVVEWQLLPLDEDEPGGAPGTEPPPMNARWRRVS